jgi:hypothetical protein
MPSAEQIADTVNRYISLIAKGSADDLVELYADLSVSSHGRGRSAARYTSAGRPSTAFAPLLRTSGGNASW